MKPSDIVSMVIKSIHMYALSVVYVVSSGGRLRGGLKSTYEFVQGKSSHGAWLQCININYGVQYMTGAFITLYIYLQKRKAS